jgi:hypothetical protein
MLIDSSRLGIRVQWKKGDRHCCFVEFNLVENYLSKGCEELLMVHSKGKNYQRWGSLLNPGARYKRGPSMSDIFLYLFQLIISLILTWTSICFVTGTPDRWRVSRVIWAGSAWWHLEYSAYFIAFIVYEKGKRRSPHFNCVSQKTLNETVKKILDEALRKQREQLITKFSK